jgi:D-beta-D-heptose 7-phosphate kinase/D-beta-D-heptose 1-phosphate adenosyltransferase
VTHAPGAPSFTEKILTREELIGRFGRPRSGRLVFTNGCFDILHPGHVAYLHEARSLGDALVVGLNTDDSVRRLKGPERPFNDQAARALVMAALASVDAVSLFGEDTPAELIEALVPDVLVKGGDYEPDTVVGASAVREAGGEVRILPFRHGYSTTALVDRIRESGAREHGPSGAGEGDVKGDVS